MNCANPSNGACLQKDGSCLICLNGFYGPNCKDKCPDNCLDGYCDKETGDCNCSYGHWGVKCEYNCSNCITNKCDKISGECENGCEAGFYGDNCKEICNENCLDKICNRKDGDCICKNGFYDFQCNKSCSIGCKKENNQIKCNKETGVCDYCVDGYWGDKCDKTCSKNCIGDNHPCKKETGYCLNGCIKGTFGPNCLDYCNLTCLEESCERDTGICEGYNDESKEYICKNNATYGEYCDKECSETCKNGCKKNGTCLGCEEGYTGLECKTKCTEISGFENCYECLQNSSKCTKCHLGFWGESCSKECDKERCSFERNETNCNIETGNCVECNKNYFGDNCLKKCNCPTNCDKFGRCSDIYCPSGFYGTGCENKCNCTGNQDDQSDKNICGKYSGECLNCDFGYFGKKCENHCYYLCKSTTCCIFKRNNQESKKLLKINTNYKYLKLNIDEHEKILQIDYSSGFTLTLFPNDISFTSNGFDNSKFNLLEKNFDELIYEGEEINSTISTEYFSDYIINAQPGKKCQINLAKSNFLKSEEKEELSDKVIEIFPMIAQSITINKEPEIKIDGVIGLGFFNMFSEELLKNDLIYRNVISYSFDKKDKDNITILFGKLNEDEIKHFDQLSYCKLVLQEERNILIKDIACKLDGLYFSEEDSAYNITNTNIIFSLKLNSVFNLNYINTETKTSMNNFFKNRYFNSKFNDNCKGFTKNNITQYYCKKNIEKYLKNIGFLINNHVYSFEPKYFFEINNDTD